MEPYRATGTRILMFIGHFAVALGAKRAAPRVSLGVLFAACQLSDLLWPIFLLFGWEHVAITPSGNPFLNVTFTAYPWSHSLLLNLVWAVLAALVYRAVTGSGRGALVVGVVVLSHWLLDLATHRPDLPLYPGGAKLGLGLWNSVAGTLVVEVAMFIAGLWLYLSATRASDGVGRYGFWALVLLISLIYLSSFTSPPPASVTALAGFAMAGWLLPFWAGWVDRHRQVGDDRGGPAFGRVRG